MTHKLLLRAAIPTDARMIANIYLAARKEFVAFAPLVHSDESIYQWVVEKLIPTNQVIVAEENNTIVGMMALSKNHGISWIDHLYLSPTEVGRGIGSLLITAAKSTLGSPICLYTFQENRMARRFYEQHGFHIIKLTDGSENEENCPDLIYEWRL